MKTKLYCSRFVPVRFHLFIPILAFILLSAAQPGRSEGTSVLSTPRQQIKSLSGLELGRLSSIRLRDSERRISLLRDVIDAPRPERVARAGNSGLQTDDLFALGKRIREPTSLRVPTKFLHEKTIGRIRDKTFAKYSRFDDFWNAAGTGTRGKFFESQSVLQANSLLKKQGSPYRYAITAVEGDPGHPADVVLLNADGKIIARYQLKSTRNMDDIIRFSLDPKYADMPIVTHPETVTDLRETLAREWQRAKRRGKPLPPKWQTVKDKLETGLITDTLVEGKRVSSYKATTENAKRFRLFQWTKGPTDKRIAERVSGAVAKSVAVPKALSKVGISIARVAKGTFIVLEVVSAPLDIGFAAYGYYDSFSRYSQGRIEDDLFAAKLAIHTTEAALGGVAVYSLGVGLGLIAAPEPIVTKVTGIIVVVGSVVVLTADMAVSAVISERDTARQQILEALTDRERHMAIREDLDDKLRAVSAD